MSGDLIGTREGACATRNVPTYKGSDKRDEFPPGGLK